MTIYKRLKSADKIKLISDLQPNRHIRSSSILKQAYHILSLDDCGSVLEIGPLRGLLSTILKHYKLEVETCDIEKIDFFEAPNYLGNFMDLKIYRKYDMVCAFQVMEHNHPNNFLPFLEKMISLSDKYIFISLPVEKIYNRLIFINNIGRLRFIFNLLSFLGKINLKRFYPFKRKYIVSENPTYTHQFELGSGFVDVEDVERLANELGLSLVMSEENPLYPYHHFFLLKKNA